MNKVKKHSVVPELRFPEFKNDDEWNVESLGKISEEIIEKTNGRRYKLMSITSGAGLVSQIEKFGKEIAGNSYKNYYVIHNGDFAYNKSSTKLYPEGEIAMFEDKQVGAVPNSIFTCFRFNENKIYPTFAKYPFVNNIHGNWLKKFIAVGARANGALQVNSKDLLSLPFPYPPILEQQKIADCLSSLDNIIFAQNQKINLLKDHKRGLLQNLFPDEGENLPKFRFKEFENDVCWEEIELEELGDLINGLTYSPNDVREDGLLVLRSSNVQDGKISLLDCVYVNQDVKGANIAKSGDILICVRNGSKTLIGKNALISEDIPKCTHGAFMTVFRAKSHKFVFQLFQTETYNRQVSSHLGATINSINGSQFIKYKFYVPKNPNEQKVISDCLSSLDNQIGEESKYLEGLKNHKKGLMQQLFPKLKE